MSWKKLTDIIFSFLLRGTKRNLKKNSAVFLAVLSFSLFRYTTSNTSVFRRERSPGRTRWQQLSGRTSRELAAAPTTNPIEEVEALLENFNCSTCNAEITVSPSNSLFIRYPDELFYSHIMVKCECECHHRLFVKVDEQADMVEYVGMAVIEIDEAPDYIKESWLHIYLDEPEYIDKCFGVSQTQELPTTDEILDEVIVQDFHKWLEEVSADEFG